MIRMFVRHAVSDFSTWKKAYDDFDSELPRSGTMGWIIAAHSTMIPGELFMTVLIPFKIEDLGVRDPLLTTLVQLDSAVGVWRPAVAANTQASPGHEPEVIGDRFVVVDTTVPPLSDQLGDHGVFWDSVAGEGFVWANVDYDSSFAAMVQSAEDSIPAVSTWGLAIMTLVLLIVGRIVFARGRYVSGTA